MKVRSLVKVIKGLDGGIHLTFFRPTFSLPYAAPNMDNAIEVARKICSDTIDFEGRPWIDYWKGSNGNINCPEGAVKLPIDMWHCKLTGEVCSLQANIKVDDKQGFLNGCHAESDKKEKIFSTIENKKYDGFHHVPGRHLCVACEHKGGKKESFYYHYHWEFAELDTAIGHSYEETKEILRKRGLPQNYVMCPLCATCCNSVALEIYPSLKKQLKLLEFNVNFRD